MTIRFEGDDDQEIASQIRALARWMKGDTQLARADIKTVDKPGRPGDMGGLEDYLHVIAENPAVIFAALATMADFADRLGWRLPWTVTVPCANGRTISRTVVRRADIAKVTRELEQTCLGEGTG